MQTASARIFCVISHRSADISWFSISIDNLHRTSFGLTLLNSSELDGVCAALLQRKAKFPVISSHV